jgi:transcriptional antiterminator RfaH
MPARCPPAEIEALRRRADGRGVTRLPAAPQRHAWARGDRVRIVAGQFASFNAIHSGMSARAREIVLINILGGQRQVAVASHLVVAAQ